MLKKLHKSNSQGFTIIEVMIVLAIAALILLIVLLAVPALQRNSRNTQRKNDTSAVVSAIGEYISNNNGAGPTDSTTLGTAVSNAKLGIYTSGNVFYQGTQASAPTTVSAPGTAGSATTLTVDNVIVIKGAVCNSTSTASAPGSSRSYAVLYAVEASSGNGQMQCVQS